VDYNTLRIEREALKTHCHNLESVVTMTHEELMSLQVAGDKKLRWAYRFTDGGRQVSLRTWLMVG